MTSFRRPTLTWIFQNRTQRVFLSYVCDTFDFSNLINSKTCHKSTGGSSLDVRLTNHPMCFHHNSTIDTMLSDHHKLILTFLKSTFKRLPPKEISYRCYKNFNEKNLPKRSKNFANKYYPQYWIPLQFFDKRGQKTSR